MRVAAVICSATIALAMTASAGASARQTRMGRLVGSTKIDVGCPAVSPGNPCQPWHLYPHAAFTVERLNAAGAGVPQTARTIESDANAHFRITLRPGSYLVTPVLTQNTTSGTALRVRVKSHKAETITIRFVAKHQAV